MNKQQTLHILGGEVTEWVEISFEPQLETSFGIEDMGPLIRQLLVMDVLISHPTPGGTIALSVTHSKEAKNDRPQFQGPCELFTESGSHRQLTQLRQAVKTFLGDDISRAEKAPIPGVPEGGRIALREALEETRHGLTLPLYLSGEARLLVELRDAPPGTKVTLLGLWSRAFPTKHDSLAGSSTDAA